MGTSFFTFWFAAPTAGISEKTRQSDNRDDGHGINDKRHRHLLDQINMSMPYSSAAALSRRREIT